MVVFVLRKNGTQNLSISVKTVQVVMLCCISPCMSADISNLVMRDKSGTDLGFEISTQMPICRVSFKKVIFVLQGSTWQA